MTFEEFLKEYCKLNNYSIEYQDTDTLEIFWNAATEAAKPRWIPVSERLPSLVNWYPCLNVNSTNWSREFFSVTDNCFKSDSGITITHWLELPELPE